MVTLVENFLSKISDNVKTVEPLKAFELSSQGHVLIDIREPDEHQNGVIEGASLISRGYLELQIESVASAQTPVIVYCASGTRSILAAKALLELGFEQVSSLKGGFSQWQRLRLPVLVPERGTDDLKKRYARQLQLGEIGVAGQVKLAQSKVLVIGAGGLGSPVIAYLAGAGVGHIGIVDDDQVDRSNLQRQIIHRDRDVGESKVASAKSFASSLNPDIKVTAYSTRLAADNAKDLINSHDIVVDGTDNFTSRYLINEWSLRLGKPHVHGAVYESQGEVTVFAPHLDRKTPCYRCLFPEAPPKELAPNCSEAGVLGTIPGIIGLLQATEVIKLIVEGGDQLVGRLLRFDGMKTKLSEMTTLVDPDCQSCSTLN